VAAAAKIEQDTAVLDAQKQQVARLPAPIEATSPPPRAAASSALIRTIQAELKRTKCYTGALDGNWGSSTKDALTRFSKLAKVDLETDEPSHAMLSALATQKNQVCLVGLGAFDGRWKNEWQPDRGCGSFPGRTKYINIKNGHISGEGIMTGTVNSSGRIVWSVRGGNVNLPQDVTVVTGRISGNQGSTTSRSQLTPCVGKSTLTRIDR
jgi:hypothetical protein